MKIDSAYETREGMILMLEKRLNGISPDYSYNDFIGERDEMRGPEEEVDPTEDPIKSVTPFSVHTFREISPRIPPSLLHKPP